MSVLWRFERTRATHYRRNLVVSLTQLGRKAVEGHRSPKRFARDRANRKLRLQER